MDLLYAALAIGLITILLSRTVTRWLSRSFDKLIGSLEKPVPYAGRNFRVIQGGRK